MKEHPTSEELMALASLIASYLDAGCCVHASAWDFHFKDRTPERNRKYIYRIYIDKVGEKSKSFEFNDWPSCLAKGNDLVSQAIDALEEEDA